MSWQQILRAARDGIAWGVFGVLIASLAVIAFLVVAATVQLVTDLSDWVAIGITGGALIYMAAVGILCAWLRGE